MSCLGRLGRLIAASLRIFWLTTLTARLAADGFSIGHHQKCLLGGPLCATPSAGTPALREGTVYRGITISPWAVSGSTRNCSMQLHAEGNGGGGNGGQILLAERSVNRVTLIGRVGLDPEVRHLPSGDRMASFSLATSEQWRDKASGEVRGRTEWHRIVVFDRGLVDLVEAFVHKGRRLYVDGTLQTRRWVASDGQERYTTEVLLSKYKGELVLLESPEDKHGGAAASRAGPTEIGTNGGITRAVGASQVLNNDGLSPGTFGSHQQPSGARNAIGARSSEVTTGIRPRTPWR